ncbi:MAG: PEGA domain-containing protein, partial [Deltaproteobacteria bacterium]|nr:PEGA domain-containing protein [Deltaproteobacteria bacterium]
PPATAPAPAAPPGPAAAAPAPAAGGKEDEAKKQEAVAALKQGKKLFEGGKHDAALPLFQKADALRPGAAPKYYAAACLDKLGKKQEALDGYKVFMGSEPGEKLQDEVKTAIGRIKELEKELAPAPAVVALAVKPPDAPKLAIQVDGKPHAGGMQIELPAGEHQIVVTAEGFQQLTKVVNPKAGEKLDLEVVLEPAPPAPAEKPTVVAEGLPAEKPGTAPAAPEAEGRSNIPAYVTLGIAGAGVVLGTVFGIQALGAKGDFDDEPTIDNADRAERAALIADMSFGVALTFGITGAVLLFSGDGDADAEAEPAEKTAATPLLAPYVGPTGAGMAAAWTF